MRQQILAEVDTPWFVIACWDGKARRVRFRCRSKAEAFQWCGWILRFEPETNPEVISRKQWEGLECLKSSR